MTDALREDATRLYLLTMTTPVDWSRILCLTDRVYVGARSLGMGGLVSDLVVGNVAEMSLEKLKSIGRAAYFVVLELRVLGTKMQESLE
mgnify:CR=1 FL=1